ncbi:MAG TPA: DUF4407 domain-containing protein [Aldersonia sp.]
MLGRGLVWLGGGQWSAAHTAPARAERSAYAVAGGVVALVALLAWLVVTLALVEATSWPAVVAGAVGVLLGALVAAVLRAVAASPAARTSGWWGRIAAACALGLLVGEIATTVLLSGAVDRKLAEEAALASPPAVVAAESQLAQAQAARTGLDTAVDDALAHRDNALVVARCEYNPTPECPTTSITGVPGAGPETTSSNELLDDAQSELLAAFDDRRAGIPSADAALAAATADLSAARAQAAANVDTGLGSRWVAMNSYTLSNPSAGALRVLTDAVFVFLALLPLLLRRWRGETALDRQIAVDTALDRARTDAEIRQIAPRRAGGIDGSVVEGSVVQEEPMEPSNELAPSPRPTADRTPALPGPLPALTRFVRPLVPPVVANVVEGAVDTARNPIRAVRQMIEEVEEITLTLKRTTRVTVHTEENPGPVQVAERVVIDVPAVETPPLETSLLEPPAPRQAVGVRRAAALLTRRSPRELPPGA